MASHLNRFSASIRVSLFSVAMLLTHPTWAQMPSNTSTTSTPIPGVGHDYIGEFGETVNPGSGSLSLRISVTMPPGRGLTLPFSFAYDSHDFNYVSRSTTGSLTWGGAGGLLLSGGWSESAPVVSASEITWTGVNNNQYPPVDEHCYGFLGYEYQDAHGDRHNLNLTNYSGNTQASACTFDGSDWPVGFNGQVVTQSGEDGWSPVAGGIIASIPPGNDVAAAEGPVTVVDPDGTTLSFPLDAAQFTLGQMATSVEDRNGNVIKITPPPYNVQGPPTGPYSYSDTLGRTILQDSGFANSPETVTIAGYNGAYTLNWQSYPLSFSVPVTALSGSCTFGQTHSGTIIAVSGITLPNGKNFSFSYDPNYGVVNQITYPTGAYVQYTWGVQSTGGESSQEEYAWSINPNAPCSAIYGVPVITDRYVSFNGSTLALHQHFAYTTNWTTNSQNGTAYWTTKNTLVTTYDLVRNTSYATSYTYSPSGYTIPPNTSAAPTASVPVEQSIAYYNDAGATQLVKTVYKTWANPSLLTTQETQYPGGLTNETVWSYNSRDQQTEEADYDFASTTTPPPTTPFGPLLKETVTNYQQFNLSLFPGVQSIADRACQIITYDSTGSNRVAETDYFYDNGSTSTPCGTAGTPSVASAGGSSLTGHDETSYSATSTTPRGNGTQKTQWLNTGTSPFTTYTYDETGQTTSMTDPKNNTTSYSYADSYLNTNTSGYTTTAGSPPSGMVTNAYLSQITYPPTNNIAHVESFSYGYNDGELTQFKDENGQTTSLVSTYRYNDSLGRLTESDFPDGGQQMQTFNDSIPNVTNCQLINGTAGATCSPTSPPTGWKTSLSTMDGLGHVVQTELVSDPDGPTYVKSVYDGNDRPFTVTNPYRSTSDSTYGVTTTVYDGAGRTCLVVPPDFASSASTTCPTTAPIGSTSTLYSTNCVTVTDEVGNARKSCFDGLGRMTGVWEAPSTYNYETDYAYDPLNNLLSVNQKGGSTNSANWRTRTFTYDSLSRLLCAANPEVQIATCPTLATGTFPAGAITYSYDPNGNLSTKTSPKANQTGTAQTTISYSYDALNRLLKKTYSDPTAPIAQFGYDGTAIPSGCGQNAPTITSPSPTNLIGRRSAMCATESGSSWSYDPMGRPLVEDRTDNGGGTQVNFSTGYTYNLDGSPLTLTYPSGNVLNYTVGGAGRPLSISDSSNTYVGNRATYAPHGALAEMANGYTSTFTGITALNTYNTRLQPILKAASTGHLSTASSSVTGYSSYATYTVASTAGFNVNDSVMVLHNSNWDFNGTWTVLSIVSSTEINLNVTGASGLTGTGGTLTDETTAGVTVFGLCYDFHSGTAVNNGPCSFSASTTGNNGNVNQVLNNVDPTRSVAYVYDPLNRIAQAYTENETSTNCWGETYSPTATAPGVLPSTSGIDAWGNLTQRSGVTGMGTCLTEGLNATATTQNQLSGVGMTYDAAGNVTNDGNGNQPTYDVENRISTDAGVTYYYDADGTRMEKSSGTKYWFGPGGEVLTEVSLSGTINEEYVYFNGERIARIDRPSGTVHYYFSNHLGSASVITDASGDIEEQTDYFPYGGIAYVSGSDTNHYKFTGKERDSESGLDNFGFRYYGSSMGRFMSPDDDSAQDQANPQSWNLFSYVMNQPTTATDPNGHDCIYQDPDSGEITGFSGGGADCDNSTEKSANSGIYIPGTYVPGSAQYDPSSQTLTLNYTPDEGGAGVAAITGVPSSPTFSGTDNGAVSPGMLGPGDLILFSGVKLPSVVTDVVGKLVGSILGNATGEAGAGVEDILAKASSSVGNQGIKAASKDAAEQAAKKWVGEGAQPIVERSTGEQVGWKSADGTKIARFTSADKAEPYINLQNKMTGGNLHVHF